MLNMKNLNLNKDNSSSLLNNSIVGSQTKESVLLIFKSLKLKLFNKLCVFVESDLSSLVDSSNLCQEVIKTHDKATNKQLKFMQRHNRGMNLF